MLDQKIDILLDELYERGQILQWLIKGYGRIGIPISAADTLSAEWIIKHYNVEMSYFKRNPDMCINSIK